MSARRELGVGLVGLGFMGRTHLAAYRDAARDGNPNRLVAVADGRAEAILAGDYQKGNIETTAGPLVDPEAVLVTTDPAEVFAHPEVDVVSICTPTDSHVELSKAALAAGKHVLVEKPVALTSAEVADLAASARASGRLCMPAMCIRFWPGWDWLKAAVEQGTYGKPRSAVFRRLGSHPAWSREFYRDEARSGGALFDLHVHDADFVRHVFGAPRAVTSTGSLHHVTTAYDFGGDPPHVVAEGGWDHTPGFPFHMGFTVIFEHATADWSIGREAPLLLARDGAATAVDLPAGTGYDGEVRHFLAACRGEERPRADLDEALALVRMLEAERTSLAEGRRVELGDAADL